ncbi:MAG: THUMP domain-containing protein [Methanobacteriota archaeon]
MVLLVRFGEIALKSRYVRRQLRDRLVGNVQDLFASEAVECVTEADEARVYVHTDDEARARGILARVFGVVSMSPARETTADRDALRALALQESDRLLQHGRSFALRPRRTGSHPFSSQDLAKDIGRAILAAHPGTRVDLSRPDVEIHIEVRQHRGFVFHEVWPGPGGLPLGSQGRALAFVDSEAGMVAAWMGMKRGCRVTIASPDGAAHVEPLRRWDVHLKVLRADALTRLEEDVRLARADAVLLGTRWPEFTQGARPNLSVPVFEPVIGLSDDEIAGIGKTIRAA